MGKTHAARKLAQFNVKQSVNKGGHINYAVIFFVTGLSNAKDDDSSVSGKFWLRINFDPLKPLQMVMLLTFESRRYWGKILLNYYCYSITIEKAFIILLQSTFLDSINFPDVVLITDNWLKKGELVVVVECMKNISKYCKSNKKPSFYESNKKGTK